MAEQNAERLARIKTLAGSRFGHAALAGNDVRWLIEQVKPDCEWKPHDNEYMPGTWEGKCGALWTFIDDGVVENKMHYCPQCGGKVSVAAAQAQKKEVN